MNKVRSIVLFANGWTMIDENTGLNREGVTLEYIITDNLSPVYNEDGSLGYRHIRESISIDNAKQITKVPGIYEMTFGYTVKKGKPVMKLKELKFVSEVDK